MYVFGFDIPLVEVFLIIGILILFIFVVMVYVLVKLERLNKRVKQLVSEEEQELSHLKELRKGAKKKHKR